MSNNTNEPKALVIPDAEQIQRDAELFGTTRQWIDWAGAVVTGQQEGSKDDVVNAMLVVRDNITALEQSNLIAHAAVAGLKEAADKLTEQRDEAVTEKAELEASVDRRIEEAQEDGWEAAMEEVANEAYYLGEDELDLDEAWNTIKDEIESYAEQLGMKLQLLGQDAAAKELHHKVQAAFRAYDEADTQIIQYQRYTSEHAQEIQDKRRELQQAAAEKAAMEHSFADSDEDEDAGDEAF